MIDPIEIEKRRYRCAKATLVAVRRNLQLLHAVDGRKDGKFWKAYVQKYNDKYTKTICKIEKKIDQIQNKLCVALDSLDSWSLKSMKRG